MRHAISAATGQALAAQCFAPVVAGKPRILILGSMPGQASLRAQQYYAHPRNAFWPIMAHVFAIAPDLPYPARLQILQGHGIALWDVLASCERRGSLDADIEADSVVVNDFAGLFARCPGLARVLFNGATAEHCFRRHVDSQTQASIAHYQRLPSTSPAHAGMPFAEKLRQWQVALSG